MKKNIWKKFAAVMIVTTMLMSMVGCEKKQDNVDSKEMVYEEIPISIDGIEGEVGAVAYKNDRIYFSVFGPTEVDEIHTEAMEEQGSEEEEHSHEEYHENDAMVMQLFSANVDGSDLKEIPYHMIEVGEIQYIMVGEDNTLTLVIESYDAKAEKLVYVLIKIDEDGRELAREDIAEILRSEEAYNLNRVMMDLKEHVIVVTDQVVYILDEKFKLIGEVKSDNYITGAALTKDGQVICASLGFSFDDGGGARVQILEVDERKWGKTYKLDAGSFSGSNSVLDGSEYDFYYRDDSGIYGYNMADKEDTKLMDYVASYLTVDRTDKLISTKDNKFLCIVNDLDSEELGIVFYTKVDPSTIADRIIITYGGIVIDESIKQAALDFNRTNKEYQIEFNDYSSNGGDPFAKMNTDIIAGNIPDIIDLNYVSFEQYVEKGMLEDLIPYINQDSELSSDDIIDSVWETMLMNGKLYYIAPSFGIDTIIGKTKDVGNEIGWTFNEFKTLLEGHGDAITPFYSDNKSDMLSVFLKNSLMDFVDWQTGECNFDGQEFKDILEFCNNKGSDKNVDYVDYRKEMASLINAGKQLFADAPGLTTEEIQIYRQMFGEDITFIGYPNKEKQGSYFRFSSRVGLSAKSEVKDGAWEFIRTFMSKEYQGKVNHISGTPTRKDCFDMLMRAKTTTEEYTDELGQEVQPVSGYWEWDDIGVDSRPLSQEEAEMYINLVNHTENSAFYDTSMTEIILEESKSYFKGRKDLDETVKIIQKRIKTYVNENR